MMEVEVKTITTTEQDSGSLDKRQEKLQMDDTIAASDGNNIDTEVEERVDIVTNEVEEEEEEGETRCVCGEIDPPDGSGLYIQCEQCAVWQHGYCVGIAEGEDTRLEKYWCERCKPELHHIYMEDNAGKTRSVYKPVQEKRRHNRRNNRHGRGSGIPISSNSGNAGNDNEKQAVDPLQISADDSSSQVAIDPPSTGSSKGRQPRGSNRSSSRDVKMTAGNNMNDEKIDLADSGMDDDKRLQDRKRATFSAREEKQYQLMLEKAIQESRRTSHQEELESTSDSKPDQLTSVNLGEDESLSNDVVTNQERDQDVLTQHSVSAEVNIGTEISEDQEMFESSNKPTINESSLSPSPGKQLPQSRSHSSNSASEDDGKRAASNRRSQRGPKAGRKAKAVGANRANTFKGRNNNNGITNNKADIGINKPMKPRLPPQRTTLSEMRRRVSAILEFISRTQWELSEEHSSKDELVRFVENQQFIDQVDSIFEKYDQSFKLMDDLTRSLLLWEKKYSSNSGIND